MHGETVKSTLTN